ncbi:protein of unknown function [Legionella micdadei]|uniref:Uncharacterized protein n=1 Tax=Legionella micdadei TaxID=451 RepID=A0A098GBM6_LEGMI|nr:protein of unknown function [Legionella micdadei]
MFDQELFWYICENSLKNGIPTSSLLEQKSAQNVSIKWDCLLISHRQFPYNG